MLPWVCQVTFCTVCKSISWTGPKNGEENDNYKETWKVLCKPSCPKVIENLMTPNWISIQSFIHPMFSVNVHVSFHKLKIMQTYTLCIHVRCTHIILLVYSYLQFLLAQNYTTTTLIPPKKGYETDVLQSWQSETAQVLSEPNPEAPWRRCNKKKGKLGIGISRYNTLTKGIDRIYMDLCYIYIYILYTIYTVSYIYTHITQYIYLYLLYLPIFLHRSSDDWWS